MKIDKVLSVFAITTCSAMIAIHCYATTVKQPPVVTFSVATDTTESDDAVAENVLEDDVSKVQVRNGDTIKYKAAVMLNEAKTEANRINAEMKRVAEEKAKEDARIEAERIEAERLEAERIEAERIEAERIAAEEAKKPKTYADIPLDEATQIALFKNCDEFSVPYHVALGVIQAESTFRATARNGSCVGYMQINHINDGWLRKIGVDNIEDPHQNLRAGTYMLADFYNRYGDWHKALMCYNCGEGGAGSLFKKGYYSSTYSRTVMGYAESWESVISGK